MTAQPAPHPAPEGSQSQLISSSEAREALDWIFNQGPHGGREDAYDTLYRFFAQHSAQPTEAVQDLPPLPKPRFECAYHDGAYIERNLYTDEHIREYARAAIAALASPERAQPSGAQGGLE